MALLVLDLRDDTAPFAPPSLTVLLPPPLPPLLLLRLPCLVDACDAGRGVMTMRCTDDGRIGAAIAIASSSSSYGCDGGDIGCSGGCSG